MLVSAARAKARWVVATENGIWEVTEAGDAAGAVLVEVEAPMEAPSAGPDVPCVEAVTAPRAVVFGCRLTCSEGQI